MQKHQELHAKHPGIPVVQCTFERCKYTVPRLAFVLEQPDRHGLPVRFVDATSSAFTQSSNYRGPMAVVDYNHDGRNSLFAMEGHNGFRLLSNVGGRFQPLGDILPGKPGAAYRRILGRDFNNDRFEDIIVLGEQASHAFSFATNGRLREVTAMAGLKSLSSREGLPAAVRFTRDVDFVTLLPRDCEVQTSREL